MIEIDEGAIWFAIITAAVWIFWFIDRAWMRWVIAAICVSATFVVLWVRALTAIA